MSCGPRYTLRAARAGERVARDRLTWQAWGELLSREVYLERERVLRATAHGRQGMSTWLLERTGGPVVASCETYRLPLRPEGAVEVIASVFVDPAARGAGVCTTLVSAMLAARLQAGLDGLVLFSEVGTGPYERAGFRLLPAPTRTFAARPGAGSAQKLDRSDLSRALALRDRVRGQGIDLRLTPARVEWHLERAAFYARSLGRPKPQTSGAIAGDRVALWAADFKGDVLRILEASGPAGARLDPLIDAAADEAAALGLSRVELWDDAHSLQLEGGQVQTRSDDLPMGVSFTPRGELFLGPLSRACWA